MFDKDFDPYLQLQILEQDVQNQRDTINKLVRFVNEQANTIQQLSEEWVKVTKQNVRLHQHFNELLSRIENET